MANRYWRGGSGTWNTTSTTNWSATSGGLGGASVPTAADSVFFDQAATYTVTMTGALTCLDITVSAGTVTFATGTTPTLTISGSMSLKAGTAWNATGQITFTTTTTGKTVTTNGTAIFGTVVFSGLGGGWTLGSSILTTGNFVVSSGTLTTNNYSISCYGLFQSNTASPRTLNLGSSLIQVGIGATGTLVSIGTVALALNAGTSKFYCTQSSGALTFDFGGATIADFELGTSIGTQSISILGANTYRNFTVAPTGSIGYVNITFNGNQIINGTLSTTGTAGNRRVYFSSATYGISYDLVVNATPSLTDVDFRNIYVTGTAAPISGTRIGNRGLCSGITFSAPKTVYWNLAGTQYWASNGWAATSGGSPSTDNFPLPQDTAIFDDAGAITSISFNYTAYVSTVNMSGRTNPMTIDLSAAITQVHGDWVNGPGTTITNTGYLTFQGGNTQTITSAGKTFTCNIFVNTYGGTVKLGDALNIGTNVFTLDAGTFDTQGYSVTANQLSSSNYDVRAINLRASTITLSNATPIVFSISNNLTFNAGTSTILCTAQNATFTAAGQSFIFYNVSFDASLTGVNRFIYGNHTFNNLTISSPPSSGFANAFIYGNPTINGTLTCNGASAVQRIFLQSNTLGTQRTLTVNSISAQNCDFRDIKIAGAASGASITGAGDCGGNSGITFPAPKTVYWTIAGSVNWSNTGWATSSGGVPAVNNFPLAQDTAVFDNAPGGSVSISSTAYWCVGTFDASACTNSLTFTNNGGSFTVYGDWKFGVNSTTAGSNPIGFNKNGGTQTITSNGAQFGCAVSFGHPSGTVQLADALSLAATRTLSISAGTFNAVAYNVTAGLVSTAAGATLRMGSGTWTLSGTGTVWNPSTSTILYVGTSTIVLSDTSTTARTFAGAGFYYNKLTIGGTTGISTLTITGANIFGELASTKTVAHTITFPSSTTTTICKWSVTGTVGNVVTLAPSTAATAYTLSIAGPASSGINYLSVSYCAVSTTSPGEFYVGANSTNTAGNTGSIFFTATPAPRTLYWVGGTGNWSSTTKWSTSSGGLSGAAIPTSLDDVVFDSLSGATSYTATVDAGVTIARCAAFTLASPATGTATFAGSVGIAFHGSVTLTGNISVSGFTGSIDLCGTPNSSYTFTTNGNNITGPSVNIRNNNVTWTLGSALSLTNLSSVLSVYHGNFDTSVNNYALTFAQLQIGTASSSSTISLNASTVTITGSTPVNVSSTCVANLVAGTSQIYCNSAAPTFSGGPLAYYNVTFNSTTSSTTLSGASTFNRLSIYSTGSATITKTVTLGANITVNDFRIVKLLSDSGSRVFFKSDVFNTQRTISGITSTTLTDVDFQDIAFTGPASPVSGTRIGDAGGNSGITFDAPKTVYRVGSLTLWGDIAWAATNGGVADTLLFPLPQDTAIINNTATNTTLSTGTSYTLGNVDMSARTNALTFSITGTAPTFAGNLILGSGVTVSSSLQLSFVGRKTQLLTTVGKSISGIIVNSPGGTVLLGDALNSTSGLTVTRGTFNDNGYAATPTFVQGSTGASMVCNGTWTINSTTGVNTSASLSGNGTLSLTSTGNKPFNLTSYAPGITINQGNGLGTLSIGSAGGTFRDITNTYSATGAAIITFGSTTSVTLTQFTGTGTAGKILTLSASSSTFPASLILTSGTVTTPNYLSISNIKAYSVSNTWYAGANSTNGGSLGWIFAAYVPPGTVNYGGFFPFFS